MDTDKGTPRGEKNIALLKWNSCAKDVVSRHE